ncbi:MAG: alpha/beta hydrolase [Nannocystaceae bacterium]|nr:alpha/beta hydrolase [Nannocystaceae bacterium]
MNTTPLRIPYSAPSGERGEVSALASEAAPGTASVGALALAHGAGADMHHRFMVALAESLATCGVATLRYQFPYTEAKRRRIDAQPLLLACVRAAAAACATHWPELACFAGGKSMGGRMTTLAASMSPLPVVGLVAFGFPLHPRGQPATHRADHLAQLPHPLLVLQGTRDELGEVARLAPCLPASAQLHVVEHADHGFDVLRRSGRDAAEVMAELARTVADFMLAHASTPAEPREPLV